MIRLRWRSTSHRGGMMSISLVVKDLVLSSQPRVGMRPASTSMADAEASEGEIIVHLIWLSLSYFFLIN